MMMRVKPKDEQKKFLAGKVFPSYHRSKFPDEQHEVSHIVLTGSDVRTLPTIWLDYYYGTFVA